MLSTTLIVLALSAATAGAGGYLEAPATLDGELDTVPYGTGYYGNGYGVDGYADGYDAPCGCSSCRSSLAEIAYPGTKIKKLCSRAYRLPSTVRVTPTVIRNQVCTKTRTRRIFHVKPVHFVTRTQITHRKPCPKTKLTIKRRVLQHRYAERPCGCARPRIIYANKPCTACGGYLGY